MSHDINSLVETIKREWHQQASEIERTVPTKDTCLTYTYVGYAGYPFKKRCEEIDCGGCNEFIPLQWEDHIYFNGEWWS